MPPRPFAVATARREARLVVTRVAGGRPRARSATAASGARAIAARERAAVASLCRKRALKLGTLRDCARRCVYCATMLCLETTTLDHVVPRAQGGPDVGGNLVAACGPCNRLKADLHPTEFFLRHPWAGENFVRYARAVHRSLKRCARRAVSLACAA